MHIIIYQPVLVQMINVVGRYPRCLAGVPEHLLSEKGDYNHSHKIVCLYSLQYSLQYIYFK